MPVSSVDGCANTVGDNDGLNGTCDGTIDGLSEATAALQLG